MKRCRKLISIDFPLPKIVGKYRIDFWFQNSANFRFFFYFRYLLYDVNHGEGFNLRRDVYMRVANLVRQLREKGQNFVLVLPPWSSLYHWQSKSLAGAQNKLPWSLFFDLESLNRFVPVIEFETFVQGTYTGELGWVRRAVLRGRGVSYVHFLNRTYPEFRFQKLANRRSISSIIFNTTRKDGRTANGKKSGTFDRVSTPDTTTNPKRMASGAVGSGATKITSRRKRFIASPFKAIRTPYCHFYWPRTTRRGKTVLAGGRGGFTVIAR